MPSETVVQLAFLPHPLIVQALNLYYAGLHFVVVIACLLIWVYVRHRQALPAGPDHIGAVHRGELLAESRPGSTARMLPGDGMIDTAARYGQSVYGSVAGFNADQLSAMPSVHVGWSLLAALVIVEVSRSRWRWLALAYPLLTMLAVVVTANHYWLDGIAAALLLGLALVVQRASRPLSRRLGLRRRAGQPEAPRAPVLTPARTSSARWQATWRPGRTSRSAGTSVGTGRWPAGSAGGRRSPAGGWPRRAARRAAPSGPPGGHVDLGHGRAQRLGVRVGGGAEQFAGRAALHHPAQVQHRGLLAQLG